MPRGYSVAKKKTARSMAAAMWLEADSESPERKLGRRIVPQPDGCWLYNDNPNVYGQHIHEGEHRTTHRLVWEILRGPIPEGHHLHHQCRTIGCCNPEHLEVLTPKEHAAAHKELRQADAAVMDGRLS